MNKTVNINLANRLFHIDEQAYNKMRRYLESIKRSFANTPGSDEIMADIEARIAELFYEKLENERQVITEKEVDEVITIMGQPEDYMVDEDIFEDEPQSSRSSSAAKRSKKLYRDTDEKYVAGVSSGLGHYFGIDALWVRLLWIFLTIFSGGGFILIYGLLWILIPEAATTSQKLDMKGEAINISNIERKVKEGFDEVADRVKSVDYEGVGNKVKSSGKTFFDTLGDIIMFFFKIFGKFIGILLIIIGAATIIGLFIGLFTVGILDMVHIPGVDFYNIVNATNTPVWLVSLLGFFAIGIPFFFLLYLGLKILVNNLKSIGNIAKFSLLGLWLISLITLIVLGIKEAAAHAYSGSTTTENELVFNQPIDTLNIVMKATDIPNDGNRIGINGMRLNFNEEGQEELVSEDVRVYLKKSKDSIARIEIRKNADGSSFQSAKETAERIDYSYVIEGNSIILNDFLTTPRENKFKDQEVRVNLFLPVGTIIDYDRSNSRCSTIRATNDRDMNGCDFEDYIWKLNPKGEWECQNCPENEWNDDDDEGNNRININEDGIDINIKDETDSFKMKINEDGVEIKAKDSRDSVDININDKGVKIDAD
ncbi:PspC domain-containing protein [Maribacter halichondriae]|uniref:PspC domain-containing protein n=1 Tax=Maribacter halichondriae TaxID=2980554 RepID=UPI002359255C|nr:PspC domain-containing protein [Maribacter sp. Hal144]